MTSARRIADLVVLAADKNLEYAVRGLLSRRESLGLCEIVVDVFVHPEHDPGCLLKSDVFMASLRGRYSHAIIMFDREGCGQEQNDRTALEEKVEAAIERQGWNRSQIAAIVVDPELEAWVWSDSPEVDIALGWQREAPNLRTWLEQHQYVSSGLTKPARPKEAMEAALRHVRKARSSSIFKALAENVSVGRCNDDAFIKLKNTLATWFPAG